MSLRLDHQELRDAPWLVYCPGGEAPPRVVKTVQEACRALLDLARAHPGAHFMAGPIVFDLMLEPPAA